MHIYRKYHISMYFLKKIIFHFPSKEKISYFLEKKYYLSRWTRKIIFQPNFFVKSRFLGHLKKILYFHVFFEKGHLSFSVWRIRSYFREKEISSFLIIQQERSYSSANFLERSSFQNICRKYHISMYFFWGRPSFIFRLKNKMIFSGKRNIIFPDNTRKIIFQRNFFGKIIFSEHLEKGNMVFHAVNQYPWTHSGPGPFQLVIFHIVVFTFSVLLLTSSYFAISLNFSFTLVAMKHFR